MPHWRSRRHLLSYIVQEAWKNNRGDRTCADSQNSKVKDPKDIPNNERFAGRKVLFSPERENDPRSGNADYHVAQAGGPGKITRQNAEHVKSDEAETTESPRLRGREQMEISGQHAFAK